MPNSAASQSKRIVFINTVYGTGSTGKIVSGLYNLSKKEGFTPYVAYGRGKLPQEYGINGIRIGNKVDFVFHVLSNFIFGNSGFASKHVTRKFLKWLDTVSPDVIHLHNLHGFYINVEMLFEYIKAKDIPVIWTLHDCWPFTGQCAHFDYANCNKWMSECHDCPIFRFDYPYSLFKDNSKNNYRVKKTAFTSVRNLTIVTPSNWLANLVKQSFLAEYPVKVINNGIDLNIFKPQLDFLSILAPYKEYDLANKKILLGVANVWNDLKGLQYMLKLSESFNEANGYQIVLIGVSKSQKSSLQHKYGTRILPITRTNNQAELALWYSAATAYINPTLQDNYPTTNLEALACGTPVITFNTGGSPEMINHENGIVVEKGNMDELVKAIKNLVSLPSHSDKSLLSQDKAMETRFMDYIEMLFEVLTSLF